MSDDSSEAPHAVEQTQVLIVGGGVVGLSAALFLRRHGVDTSLVERHPGTSIHPRARGVNPRTMEMYREIGLEPQIREAGAATPIHLGILSGETLAEAIAAPVPRLIRRALRELMGQNLKLPSASPTTACRITQDLLEPVLASAARERGARLSFSTELVSFSQDADGVEGVVLDRGTGATRSIRAQFLIAADGARSPMREKLGISTSGRGSLGHLINVLFEADLADFVRGREFSIAIIHRPEMRGLFAALNNRDRWVFHIVYDPKRESPKDYPPERCIDLIRLALGAGDVPIHIKSALPWESAARVADLYRAGRIFLAGDAAHLMPPWGGMGANTGIADAHNLCWKLALVLGRQARPALLDTYQAERRPVGVVAAEDSADNADEDGLLSRGVFSKMLGWNRAALWSFLSRKPAVKPGRLVKLLGAGFQYASAAITPDTAPAPHRWRLDGRPGTRMPHSWVERSGTRVSALDLVTTRLTLLSGAEAAGWCDAAREVASQLGLDLDVLRAGHDFDDPRDRWQRQAGIAREGALLVRPDGIVAWRAPGRAREPAQTLGDAIRRALALDA